ncbi:hypothetical protein [Streptomyces olivaceoviridis]|uniref:hypothetical protein n=1 Tax=Streptomyces olivaceoviridis TaxID=1921 RepID=UPI00332163F2
MADTNEHGPGSAGDTPIKRAAGARAALGVPAGRPKADPREKEIARLGAANAKLRSELGKARTVIEVRGRLCALLDRLPTGSDETDGREAVTATTTPPQPTVEGVSEAARAEALEPTPSLPGRTEPGDIV